jgi:uncharacterized protein YbaR (Trm112 family)
MPKLDALLPRLVCPRCRGPLLHREQESALDCPACSLRYPIEGDIPVLMTDRAQPLGEAAPTS